MVLSSKTFKCTDLSAGVGGAGAEHAGGGGAVGGSTFAINTSSVGGGSIGDSTHWQRATLSTIVSTKSTDGSCSGAGLGRRKWASDSIPVGIFLSAFTTRCIFGTGTIKHA